MKNFILEKMRIFI